MINSVVLMGRLTYDPELKITTNGVAVIHIQIACDRTYQTKGEEKKADFIDITAWRKTADFISKYFHKGSMIAVEGSIRTTNFTDKNDNKRKNVEVIANKVSFCDSKSENSVSGSTEFSQPEPSYASADGSDFEEIVDDDLPF